MVRTLTWQVCVVDLDWSSLQWGEVTVARSRKIDLCQISRRQGVRVPRNAVVPTVHRHHGRSDALCGPRVTMIVRSVDGVTSLVKSVSHLGPHRTHSSDDVHDGRRRGG